MYKTLLHLFWIKTSLLSLIFCCGVFSEEVDTSRVGQQCPNTYPDKVSFRRIQSYHSFVLNASGIADFNSNQQIVVVYRRPFKYSVCYTDTATIALGKDGKAYTSRGFKDAEVSDPFQALMVNCSVSKQDARYIGAFDSVRIYEGNLYNKKCRFSIDRTTQLIQEITYVNGTGAVYERMLFYYKKDQAVPSSVVIFKSTGGDLVRDSLAFF
jgi:hypothetical protein